MNHTNTILLKSVEQDNLETFLEHFILDNWRDTVTKIDNYAGVNEYNKTVTQDNCDIFKYAVHCNATTIFNYLLPLVDTEKHGNNYGWPLLSMALKNNRYDFANMIINHKSFNPYHRYHNNCFSFIETRNNPDKHIEFLFNYLDKFYKYDLQDSSMIYTFSHLACYNEATYSRFMQHYRNKTNNPQASILDFFQNKLSLLGKEIFYNYFRTFLLDKFDEKELALVFKSVMDDNIVFMPLFESEQAKLCLSYLLKHADLLQEYINNNQVIVSYLNIECILLLEKNNIDLWIENEKNTIAVDYILDNSNLNDCATVYFMNKYTQQIFDRLEKSGYKSNVYKYCHNKLLMEKMPVKNVKNTYYKI